MNGENRIMNVLGQVDGKYIEEAAPKTARKKPVWVRWASLAACFALAAVLGAGALYGGWFRGSETARTDSGAVISFGKCKSVGGALSLDIDATSEPLTAEEAGALFGDLPFEANAVFTASDKRLIGFDGKIGAVKLLIATSELPLSDTVLAGNEETSEIDGVSVRAGYFVTDPNSNGEQTAIYFASFNLGTCTFYLESAGEKPESEAVKNELAALIQRLIASGEPDISRF